MTLPPTMRAMRLPRLEGPDALELADVPTPSNANDVIIEVHAAGVAFADLLTTRGQYQVKPPLPFIPGSDIAGIVVSAPAGSPFRAGDRVAGIPKTGAWAEYAAAAPTIFPIPDGMAFDAATAMTVNYQTSYFGLIDRAQLRAGETVLVHGAAGGVGSAAVQIARAAGATVIAVVRGDDKATAARDSGADHCVDSNGEWLKEVRALTGGRGVDVVYDPVGGDRFLDSVRSMAPGGRLLVVGFAGGEIPTVKVNRLLLNNTSVLGVAWPEYARVDPNMPRGVAAGLAKMWDAGFIKPVVGARYPLERAADALREIESRRAIGKVVLVIREPSM
jgi:NADPH2:quinone reductase